MAPAAGLIAVHERTMLLSRANVSAHLDMRMALDASGLTSSQLRQVIEEGLVYAETPDGRAWRRISRDHLFAYVTRVLGQPLTLFTTLVREAAEHGVRLDEEDFRREQDTFAASVRDCTIYRLLRRDHRVPDTPVWAAWFRGDIHHAQDLLHERQDFLKARADGLANRGVATRTVWATQVQPTPYQRYLMAALHHSSRAGYPTRVLSTTCLRHVEYAQRTPLPDFTAYQGQGQGRVFLRSYTDLGRADGGVVVDHPELCERLCEQVEDYYRQGRPFPDFRLDHGNGGR
jgi:hypothetical protein